MVPPHPRAILTLWRKMIVTLLQLNSFFSDGVFDDESRH